MTERNTARCATALLAAVGLICLLSAPALAAPPSVTLSGSPNNFLFSPNTENYSAQIDATLSAGVASDSLTTVFRTGDEISGVGHVFEGTVTCMLDLGDRFVVGALGSDRLVPEEAPPRALPGTYAQLLTVTYGEYPNWEEEFGTPFHSKYGGMIGENQGGVPSAQPPNCATASFEDPLFFYATHESDARVSPSIASPGDGRVVHGHRVMFRGMGEPGATIALYEVGHREVALETKVDAEGRWSRVVSRLAAGNHTFIASALSGSTVPSNTVEIEVRR